MRPATIQTYCNPLNMPIADPFVLLEDGMYYLYGTWEGNWHEGIPVFTSRDLVNWQYRGYAWRKSETTWGQSNFWGPEIVRYRGELYMFLNASPNRNPVEYPLNMRICVAKGVSPLGPFTEIKTPLYNPLPGDEAIDQNIFIDTDGSVYNFFTRVTQGRNEIQVVKMKDSLVEFDGDPQTIIVPDQEWDSRPWENHRVAEGSCVLKHKNLYYLMYTGNHYLDPNYAIGYAIADNPMGPYRKYEANPILKRSSRVVGTGNGWVVASPDGSEHFLVYHTHQSVREVSFRQLAIDRIRFVETPNGPDRLVVDGPTSTPQPLPSGAPFFAVGCSDSFDEPELDRSRWVVLGEQPDRWEVRDGTLRVTATDGDMYKNRTDYKNLFLQYAPTGDYSIMTEVMFSPSQNYEQAFMCVFDNHDHYLRLSYGYADGLKLLLAKEDDGEFGETTTPLAPSIQKIFLKIVKQGDQYTGMMSPDGKEWTPVGTYEMEFQLPRVGVSAIAPVSTNHPVAEFGDFQIIPSGD